VSAAREATSEAGRKVEELSAESLHSREPSHSPSEIEQAAHEEFTSVLEDKYDGSTLYIVSEDQESFYTVNPDVGGSAWVGCLDPVDQTEKAVNGDLSHSVTNFWMGETDEIEVDEGSIRSMVRPEYAVVYSLGDDFVIEAENTESGWDVRAKGNPYGNGDETSFSFSEEDISERLGELRSNLNPGDYKLASDYHTKASRGFHSDTIKQPLNDEDFRVDSNGGSFYQAMVATGQNHIGLESDPTKPTEGAGGVIAEAAGMERESMLGNEITQIPVILTNGLKRTLHEVVWNSDRVNQHPLNIINLDEHIERNEEKGKPVKPLEDYYTSFK
jgi:hypothetical protein